MTNDVDPVDNATELSPLVNSIVMDESTADLSALFISELHKYRDFTLHHLDDSLVAINEVAFWTLSAYEVLIPAILQECALNSTPQSPMIDLVWNNLGGVSDLITGLAGLADNSETSSQKWWKLKRESVIYLGNGAQIIALTALASAALPIGFAVGSGVDLYLSMDPLKHAYNRHYDFKYWLTDSLTRLEKLEQKVDALQTEIQKFSDDIQCLTVTAPLMHDSDSPIDESHPPIDTDDPVAANLASAEKWRDWILQQKAIRLQKAQDECFLLKRDIFYRISHRKTLESPSVSDSEALSSSQSFLKNDEQRLLEDLDKEDPTACKQRLLAFNTTLQHIIETTDKEIPIVLSRALQTLPQTLEQRKLVAVEVEQLADPSYLPRHEQRLSKATEVELIRKIADSTILLIACVGWTLMCIPGLQIPGAFIVGLAAALYLVKHAEAIQRNASSTYRYLFSTPDKPLHSANLKPLPPIHKSISSDSTKPLLGDPLSSRDATHIAAQRTPSSSIDLGISSTESTYKAPLHQRILSNVYGMVAAFGTLALLVGKNLY